MELATKVDAAIENGDSLYCHFCLDSLLDHIAAKVFAPEMDEEPHNSGLRISERIR
jgi:hypothetical protein